MENMPLLILLGIGGLLVVIVILFVMAQKKQKKSDGFDEMVAPNNLEIDLKSASEDIDDTAASLDSDKKADVPVKPPVKISEPEAASKPDPEPDPKPEAQVTPVDEPVEEQLEEIAEFVEEQDDDEKISMDDLNMIANEVDAVVAEPGIVPASDSLDPTSPDEDDSMLNIFETGEEDMSELDALFGATSDVEEHIISGMEGDDDDILEDLQDDDFLSVAPKEPESAEYQQESEPLRAIQPKPAPVKKPTPPPPPATPVKPAEPDPEEQKRHDKAKRIARVIVNDIRNYNPDKLAEGIRMGGIMKTLGKEVERGRLLYIKRVPPEITRETNYYKEALIKILADGQPDLLGF